MEETVLSTVLGMLMPDLERKLRTAGRKVAQATEERDEVIRLALAAGGSLREIGEAVGLSHQAVKLIGQRDQQ